MRCMELSRSIWPFRYAKKQVQWFNPLKVCKIYIKPEFTNFYASKVCGCYWVVMRAHVDAESTFRVPMLKIVMDLSKFIWLGSGDIIPWGGAEEPGLVQPGGVAPGCPEAVPTTRTNTCEKVELGSSQYKRWNKRGSGYKRGGNHPEKSPEVEHLS